MAETSWRTHRARVGALSRDRSPSDPELVNARRDLAACVLEERVRRVMTDGPALTVEQRARIVALLQPPPVIAKPRRPRPAAA